MSSRQGAPHPTDLVHAAHSARAREYINLFGRINSTTPEDRDLVSRWAHGCTGRVINVGCGPGHWTACLTEAGLNAKGIDPVAKFIDHAQRTYPTVQSRQGTIDDLVALPGPLGGILSWHSPIHLNPGAIPTSLAAMHESMAPGGQLLLGFFDGTRSQNSPAP